MNKVSKAEALKAVDDIISHFVGNEKSKDLQETPRRFIESLEERLEGYKADPAEILKTSFEGTGYNDEMVLLRNIDLESICEHHLLPFIGKAHVAYIPNDKVVGISKLARLVDAFSKRLQIQERLTIQIADAINYYLKPKGVAVLIEASHSCMVLRGVKKKNAKMITYRFIGELDTEQKRNEFFEMIKK